MQLHRNRGKLPLGTFEFLSSLVDARVIPPDRVFNYMLCGKSCEPGKGRKILSWCDHHMPLPAIVLQDARVRGRVVDAMRVADKIGEAVGAGVRATWRAIDPGNKNRRAKNDDDVAAEYWGAMELPFRRLLDRMSADAIDNGGEGLDELSAGWTTTCERAANAVFEVFSHKFNGTSRRHRAVELGRSAMGFQIGVASGRIKPRVKAGVANED
jgi:hypothetical protein